MLKELCLLTALLLCVNASSAQSRVPNTPETAPDTINECAPDDLQCTDRFAHDPRATRPESRGQTPTIRVAPEVTSAEGSERPLRSVPVPPERPTEFQQFVEDSLGKRLPLFGYNLFQSVPSTFAPLDRIPVPANYVVGPGDELLIRGWGQIDVDARVIVDRNGQIYLPKVGSVSVAGVTYDQLADHLKAAVGRVFRNFDLRVTLGQLRSIQIFVVGYARRPGSYTVSSLSTLVNALFASGGPSLHGSMRHIQVKRGGAVVSDFDLYAFLLKGDKSKDVVLLPGDVVYIPPVGPQVALAGSVNFPAIYELHSTATLAEAMETAGGLTSVADGGRVVVERIENRTTRKVDEFTLDGTGNGRELRDGDLVRVFSISPRFENAVTLRGNVAQPGRYPFRPGMKIRDLIPNREFLLTRAYWQNQNAVGDAASAAAKDDSDDESRDGSNTEKRSQRELMDRAKADWRERSSVIAGQAELRNDVKRNAPDINWDYAVIQRINPVDLSTVLVPFNLGKAILEGTDADNLPLQAGDVISIFSQRDIEVAVGRQTKFVRLEGEFRAPGVYKVNPGENLRSIVARAGGLSDGAFLYGAQFKRESARQQQQASLDELVRNLEMESHQQAVYAAAADGSDRQGVVQAQLGSQRALVEQLRQLKATGRVVLEMKPSDTGIESFPEILLEDGDSLFVPHKPATVSVVGSVYNQNSFLFRRNSSVQDYLKMAGSGNRDADLKHMFVIRADGSVVSRRNTSGMWSGGLESVRVQPGDTLVVPTKLDKGSAMRAIKDWSQVFSQFGLAAAAINVLR